MEFLHGNSTFCLFTHRDFRFREAVEKLAFFSSFMLPLRLHVGGHNPLSSPPGGIRYSLIFLEFFSSESDFLHAFFTDIRNVNPKKIVANAGKRILCLF